MRKKTVSLLLAFLMALAVCGDAALASGRLEAAAATEGVGVLYCRGRGGHHGENGHHGGSSHHGKAETCGWLFHACVYCGDVYCTDESHAHRCPVDCTDHDHYSVRQYADGTLELVKKKA